MEVVTDTRKQLTSATGSVHAVFDFDKTLTTRDTLRRFVERVAGRAQLYSSAVSHPITAVRAIRSNKARDEFKSHVLRNCLGGKSQREVDEVGKAYSEEILRNYLRMDVLARLRWHQGQGHITTIVSASLNVYLNAVAENLGVDHLCCTELEMPNPGNPLTGVMATPNCRGIEKVRRIQALGVRSDVTYAYGDSRGDAEMLKWSDHPVLVTQARIPESPFS